MISPLNFRSSLRSHIFKTRACVYNIPYKGASVKGAKCLSESVTEVGADASQCGLPKGGEGRILDEFVAVTGYHRKSAIRALTRKAKATDRRGRPRIYTGTR